MSIVELTQEIPIQVVGTLYTPQRGNAHNKGLIPNGWWIFAGQTFHFGIIVYTDHILGGGVSGNDRLSLSLDPK